MVTCTQETGSPPAAFMFCGDLNIYSLCRLKHDLLLTEKKQEENHIRELKRQTLCANLDNMAHYQFFIAPPVEFLCHFLYSVEYFSWLHPSCIQKNLQTFAARTHWSPLRSFDAIVTLDHISGLSELEPHVWHSSHWRILLPPPQRPLL